jgi:formamidopyrimidine-DNA glycosylase
MPELPEVESARRRLEKVAQGRKIVRAIISPDPIVFEGVPRVTVRRALEGATVTGAGRRGKHLWLELDRRPWPCFHFGMTGELSAYGSDAARPRFLKLEMVLDSGMRIALSDARRLGRIRQRSDPL